jgi:dinuclear metal center YbgI/SA1388 family protein
MLTLAQLVQTCNQLYPNCPDGSFNGLQIEGQPHVSRVATAVSADLHTIDQAIQADCQALIVHHGLFWERSNPCLVGFLGRRAKRLLETGISLLAYHLPMDIHAQIGNNWTAAQQLGMSSLQPFGRNAGLCLGVQGLIGPMPVDTLHKVLENYYGNNLRHAAGSGKTIQRLAILSGGGHRWLEEAAEAGCDALVTGTADEPQWHQARELGVHLFAVGHSASERVGPKALAHWLAEHAHVEAIFLQDENPF